MAGLLQGVRVAEVAAATTEHAGRTLAELGAEVLLIEPPEGAVTRRRRPFVEGTEPSRRSVPFLARNTGKRSVVVAPADAAAAQLLATVAVLLAPAGSPFLDLPTGPRPPVTVVVDDDGLGDSSIVAFAASGGMSSSGWPHQPPCNAPSWLAHDAAGVYAAGLALTGLWMVAQGRPAPRFTVSLRAAAIAGLTPWTRPLMSYDMTVAGQGVTPARLGGDAFPIYPCKDGFVRVLTGTPRQWQAWKMLLGNPEALAGDEWLAAPYRAQNFDAIFLIGKAITRDRTRAELFTEGQQHGLTITPVLSPAELLADPHVQARGLFRPVRDPDLGEVRLPRAPYSFPNTDLFNEPVPAPALDQDSATVLAELDRLPQGVPAPVAPPPARAATDADQRLPLAGLRVLNLGVGAVAPELASLMALLGAEVIKVESRRYPDFLRRGGIAGPGDPNASPAANQMNLGVLSCAVDLSTEEGRALVLRLAARCDVVLENLRGGVVAKWGLEYEAVRRVRPAIVYVSSQGLGEGVYNGFQTYGPNLQAFSGVTALWAHPDDPYPTGTTLNHPDHLAGKQFLVPVLAALLRRDATGAGLFIDAAQFEFAATLLSDKLLQEQLLPGSVGPLGNAGLDSAPHGCYPCRAGSGRQPAGAGAGDRWVALSVESDKQWRRFSAAVAQPWTADFRFATTAGRLHHREALDGLVATWTGDHSPEAVEQTLTAAGIPASRVVTGYDLQDGAGDEPGGLFPAVTHPTVGTRRYTGAPFVGDRYGRLPVRHAPLLGEHTEYVLYDLLQLSGDEVTQLAAAGVIGH